MENKPLKIFHGPANISGMAGILAESHRQLGHDALSCSYYSDSFNYPVDINPARRVETIRFLATQAFKFDVYQFYFGNSLLSTRLSDIPLLKKLGKKIFFYFCGCDVRDREVTIKKYRYSACANCWPTACSPNRKKDSRGV